MADEREDYKNGIIGDYTPVRLEMSILDYQKEIEEVVSEDGEVDKFTQVYGVSSKFFKKLFSDPSMEGRAKEFLDKIIDFCRVKNANNGLFFVPIRKVGQDLVKLAKRLKVGINFMSLCGGQEDDTAKVEHEMKESDAERLNAFYSEENPDNEIRIGITCNKCGTGTTLKDLDFVAFLKETSNAVSFIQQSQRCRTPKAGKEKAYVLCFNQWSGLKAFCDYAKAAYDNKEGGQMSDAERIQRALENGAISITLNLTDDIDYDYVVDFMSCYHPGEELFTDVDFESLEGFDFAAFLRDNDLKSVKNELAKKHPGLRNDPDFGKAKTIDELNKALAQNGIGEKIEVADVRSIFQKSYVNVLQEMLDDGMDLAQIKDFDDYSDYVKEVYLNGELRMTMDGWESLNNVYSTYIPKVINYIKMKQDASLD